MQTVFRSHGAWWKGESSHQKKAGRQEDPSQISLNSSPHGVSTLYPPPGYRAVTANFDWVSWRKFDSWTPWRSRVFRIDDAIQRGTREGRLPDRGEDHPKMGQRWTMEWLDPDAKRCNLPCLFSFPFRMTDRFPACVYCSILRISRSTCSVTPSLICPMD